MEQFSSIKNFIKMTEKGWRRRRSSLMENHQRNVEIDWIFNPNEEHSSRKQKNTRERERCRKMFCIHAMTNWRWTLSKASNMRVAIGKFPLFHVKTLFVSCDGAPLLTLNNRNNDENKKQTKSWAESKRQPTDSEEGEGRCCEWMKQLTAYERTGFFSFRRC